MFTGYRPSPAIQYPSFGSIVSHEFGARNDLPPYVCIPSQPNTFAGTGYLGSAYGPFSLGNDPSRKEFKVRDLSLPGGVDEQRFAQRREMRAAVDAHFSALEKSDALEGMDSFYQRAYSMISSDKARAAFSLNDEPEKLREEYGPGQGGMRMMLARRLVEAGVRFVSLTYGGWDHHDNIKNAMNNQVPRFDRAFAALIRDLDQRGLLDSTLVMVTTEFGRTPKINGTAGRDHYPKVFSIVLAGGGIKRGYIHGASDPTGGEPESNPLTVPDLAATVYNQLGIDPTKILLAPGNRPIAIVKDGEVQRGLLV
jgi:arylsulfatase A-like enzyme